MGDGRRKILTYPTTVTDSASLPGSPSEEMSMASLAWCSGIARAEPGEPGEDGQRNSSSSWLFVSVSGMAMSGSSLSVLVSGVAMSASSPRLERAPGGAIKMTMAWWSDFRDKILVKMKETYYGTWLAWLEHDVGKMGQVGITWMRQEDMEGIGNVASFWQHDGATSVSEEDLKKDRAAHFQ
jgi:hypothetical protein